MSKKTRKKSGCFCRPQDEVRGIEVIRQTGRLRNQGDRRQPNPARTQKRGKPRRCEVRPKRQSRPPRSSNRKTVAAICPHGRCQSACRSICRETAEMRSRFQTMPARNSCCFSIPAPIRRAARGRRSTSPASRKPSPPPEPPSSGCPATRPKAQEAFRNKHQLSVPLASDEKHEMLEAYGAWGEKSMYGRTFEGILRTTVLIGADGQIVKVWRNVQGRRTRRRGARRGPGA